MNELHLNIGIEKFGTVGQNDVSKISYPNQISENIIKKRSTSPKFKKEKSKNGRNFKNVSWNEIKEFNLEDSNKIGNGKFGDIYKYKKGLAIKLNKGEFNYLIKEINSLNGKKNNKNILNIYEYWNNLEYCHSSNNLLVMELCNCDFFTFIQTTSFLERITFFNVFLKDILNGLFELHKFSNYSNPIIHHDIKPENILIKYNTNCLSNCCTRSKYTFKLCDFGSTNILHSQITDLVSTMNYSPPELNLYYNYHDDNKNILTSHPSMDFYSLGILLFCLVTQQQYIGTDEIFWLKTEINKEEYWNNIIERNKNRMKEIFNINNNYDEILFNRYFNIIQNLTSFNPRQRINFLKKNKYIINDYPLKLLDNLENKFLIEDKNNINWFHQSCNNLIIKNYVN